MKPLLCVRFQESAPLGVVEEVLDTDGVPWRYVDAWKEEVPNASDGSGLVVLGGEMNVDDFDGYPFLKSVHDLVGDAIERRAPVLGICLGAQTVARVLGAEVARAPVPEIGFHEVVPTDEGRVDPVAAPFTGEFPVFQWHEDAFEVPAGAIPLHRSKTEGNNSFRYGDRVYALQFHMEVTEDIVTAWCDETDAERLESYWKITKRDLLDQAKAHLPAQRRAAGAATRRFVELIGGGA